MTIDIDLITSEIQDAAPQIFADGTTKYSDMLKQMRDAPPINAKGPTWKVKTVAGSGATTFAEGGEFPAPAAFETEQALLSWGRYVRTILLTGEARDQLELQGSATFIANYFAEQIREANMDMVDTLDGHLRGGLNTNGLTGITEAINATNTYASIDRTTVANFKPHIDSAAAALTKAKMDAVHNELTDVIGGRYDAILTGAEQHDNYTALSTGNGVPALRLNTPQGATGQRFVSGFGNMEGTPEAWYNGRPLIKIPGYPAGRMDFVWRNDLSVEFLRRLRTSAPVRKNDDFYWDLTTLVQFKITNPRKHTAAITALT